MEGNGDSKGRKLFKVIVYKAEQKNVELGCSVMRFFFNAEIILLYTH